MCGGTDDTPLPDSADKIQIDDANIETLLESGALVSDLLVGDKVVAKQACYLPLARDGDPLIGAHPSFEQLYIATGHSCWGILNSPITGRMMAELLIDGQISCVPSFAVKAVDPAGRL